MSATWTPAQPQELRGHPRVLFDALECITGVSYVFDAAKTRQGSAR